MKKFLSLFLVLTMCMSLLPVSVFSEDETTVSENQSESVAPDDSTVVTKTDSTADTTAETTSTGETGSAETSQPSEISLETLPLDEPFNLEDAYDYYLTLDEEEAELYLASLSDDNRFMLLDYIDAMNEIATLKAEAEVELAKLEADVAQELQEDVAEADEELAEVEAEAAAEKESTESEVLEGQKTSDEKSTEEQEQLERLEQSEIEETVESEQQEEPTQNETESQTGAEQLTEESSVGQSENDEDETVSENTENECTPVVASETAEFDTNENTTYPVTGTCGANEDGSNVTWSLSESGVLTLSGTGAMADYTYTVVSSTYMTTAPWADYSGTITSVTINLGITNIGNYAFYRLSALSSITIPEGVTTIGKYAFYKCTSLTTIGLPSTLTSIGNNALTEVTQINFAGTNEEWNEIGYVTSASTICSDGEADIIAQGTYDENFEWFLTSTGYFEISGTGVLLDDNSIASGASMELPWHDYSESILKAKICEGITEVNRIFYECTNLKEVEFPSTLEVLGFDSLRDCISLQNIDIPDNVSTIESSVFYGCTNLETINLSRALTSLGNYAFFKCTSLKNVELFSNLTNIGSHAFSDCSSLTNISIPDSVTILGEEAFYNCTALTNVRLSDGITSIETSTFYGCTSLNSVSIPDSVKCIKNSAFYGCIGLITIFLPESVKTLESYAFYGCSSLESISIPDDITNIGDYTFYKCSSLTNINLPSNLTSIGERAFANCTFTSIIIPSKILSIGKWAFEFCRHLVTVKFIGNAPTIATYSFYKVTATVYYPGNDTTWTSDIMKQYSGTLTWTPYGDTALRIDSLNAGETVYSDGVSYTVSSSGAIDVPLSTTALMTFTYSGTSSTDAHVQYPTGVKVYAISLDDDGNQIGTYVSALDNVLTYSGASIKTVDNQGLRIIYSIPDATKTALIAGTLDGLTGYTLAEFGTVATWADTSTNPYLGCTGAMTSYSYRASESYDDTDLDTELNYSDTSFYYTNAFVFTNFERTKPDLAVRPYMILNTPDGNTMTIYGGVVIRNIGYVAVQCLNDFTVGTVQYNYVKKIVDYVYPDGYTEWSSAKY